jgi:hypothetical protein
VTGKCPETWEIRWAILSPTTRVISQANHQRFNPHHSLKVDPLTLISRSIGELGDRAQARVRLDDDPVELAESEGGRHFEGIVRVVTDLIDGGFGNVGDEEELGEVGDEKVGDADLGREDVFGREGEREKREKGGEKGKEEGVKEIGDCENDGRIALYQYVKPRVPESEKPRGRVKGRQEERKEAEGGPYRFDKTFVLEFSHLGPDFCQTSSVFSSSEERRSDLMVSKGRTKEADDERTDSGKWIR